MSFQSVNPYAGRVLRTFQELSASGIREFVNKKLVRVASIDASA